MKKLCRSYHDRKICGVCGGIGEYLGVDPTVVRLVFVVLGLLHVGIILYIAAAILMPTEQTADTPHSICRMVLSNNKLLAYFPAV